MKGFKIVNILLFTPLIALHSINTYADDPTPPTGTVCMSQFVVTTPQTVTFYAEKINKKHFIGTTKVGALLYDNQHCITDGKFIAVTWDENGRQHRYKTTDTFTNVDTRILVQYPNMFKNAPENSPAVLCQLQIINKTPAIVDFYAGKKKIQDFLVEVGPNSQGWRTTPCFVNKKLIAEAGYTTQTNKIIKEFVSEEKYSNVNSYPLSLFPQNYSEKTHWFSTDWFSSSKADDAKTKYVQSGAPQFYTKVGTE